MSKPGKLRQLRLDRGASLTDVSTRTGIEPSMLSRIEVGSRRPSVQDARALFEHYEGDISLGEIHDPTHPQYAPPAEKTWICVQCGEVEKPCHVDPNYCTAQPKHLSGEAND